MTKNEELLELLKFENYRKLFEDIYNIGKNNFQDEYIDEIDILIKPKIKIGNNNQEISKRLSITLIYKRACYAN